MYTEKLFRILKIRMIFRFFLALMLFVFSNQNIHVTHAEEETFKVSESLHDDSSLKAPSPMNFVVLLANLENNLKSTTVLSEKIKHITEYRKNLGELLGQYTEKDSFTEEFEHSIIHAALRIVLKKEITPKTCENKGSGFKVELLFYFEPKTESSQPKSKSLKSVFRILDLLCTNESTVPLGSGSANSFIKKK